jgi:hypothetical protein
MDVVHRCFPGSIYATGQAAAVALVAVHALGVAAYMVKAERAAVPEGESERTGRLKCSW